MSFFIYVIPVPKNMSTQNDLSDLVMLAAFIKQNPELADKLADELKGDPTKPRDAKSLMVLLSAAGGASASGGAKPDFVPFPKLTSDLAVLALKKLYDGVTYATSEWNHLPVMRMMARMKVPFNEEAAKELLADLDTGGSVFVDYFQEQCFKVHITPTGISTEGYNKNHGPGLAEKILG